MAFGSVVNSSFDGNVATTPDHTQELGATATLGNLLIVALNWDKGVEDPTVRDEDGSGDFWTQAAFEVSADGTSSSAIFYKISHGDETEAFVAWTNDEQLSIGLFEIEGAFDATPLDLPAVNSVTSPSSTFSIGATATLAQADNYAIFVAGQDTGGDISIDSGDGWTQNYTFNPGGSGDNSSCSGSQITSATTALTANLTSTSSDEWSGVIAVFKKATVAVTYQQVSFRVYKKGVND